MMMTIQVDVADALRRTGSLKRLGKATRFALTEWATQTVRHIKTRRILKVRTGHLYRNVGMEIDPVKLSAIVGTGVGRAKPVIYANVQDEGATIRKKGKFLTIPFPGVLGSAENYRGATRVIRSKKGTLTIVMKSDGRPLFSLKESVKIPASGWISGPIREMDPVLKAVLDPSYLEAVAKKV